MPTSHHGQLNEILDLIIATNPKKMLDIGIGFGKYGFLSREYLELADGRDVYNDWTRQIDGIEAFGEYVGALQKQVYDNIYIGNVLELMDKIDTNYDLIILIDVLEHFTYEQGIVLLEKLISKTKHIIISTPIAVTEQGNAFNNVYETHRFEWKKKHFKKHKNISFIKNSYSLICLIGENAKNITKEVKRHKLKIYIATRFPWTVKLKKYYKKNRLD